MYVNSMYLFVIGEIVPQILSDQLTLSQPGGKDYAHYISTGTPGFSDPLTAL